MSYLFSFKGRINRAKIWLFFLVTMAWEIVAVLVAIIGLRWTNYLHQLQTFNETRTSVFAQAPQPWPDPVSGTGWIAVGVIALLALLYVVAYLAIYTKRLHDRNKSAWWLLPYMVLPWALNVFVWTTGPMRSFPVGLWISPMGMARGVAYILACLLALWVFIELYFFRGTRGDNRFGPDPLA